MDKSTFESIEKSISPERLAAEVEKINEQNHNYFG